MLKILRAVFVGVVTVFILSGFTSADMTVDPQGNVGVGTETPETKLDVDGTIRSRNGGYKFPDGTTLDSAARFGSPPLKYIIGEENSTNWDCECNVDLKDYCGDEDGCKIRVLLQYETSGYDEVRCFEEKIYMEQPTLSSNRLSDTFGWSWSENRGFRTGGGGKYEIFGAWDWVYMYNYTHSYCPQGVSAAYAKPHDFSFMVPPAITATIVVYD